MAVLQQFVAQSLFIEFTVLLMLAATVGFAGLFLQQPLIVAFIAVGIIAGPSGLDITRSNNEIAALSQLGIAVLLFLVGLKLDIKLVRSLGVVSLTTGLGQVAFTAGIGFLICLALGMNSVTSLYVAVALTFSSTIIIVKLLSDKRETDALHGQIALGFLIVQDIVVVIAMIALSAIGVGTQTGGNWIDVLVVLGYGFGLVGVVLLFVRYLADPLTERLAHSPELLLLFAISQAAGFAAIGHTLGFGKELGGLLAGVSLASTPYREALAARLAPLRDFLLLFFFIALGTRLDFGVVGSGLMGAGLLSLFVLIGNPLIVLAIMGAMGYRKRTGFLAGLTVAQISEFSLIFMAMGVTLGHIGSEALGLVTVVGLVTIAASTYMITYSHELYAFCEPMLRPFERRRAFRELDAEQKAEVEQTYNAVVLGIGRLGAAIATRLERQGSKVLCVDFNSLVVKAWRKQGRHAIYGDVTDPELLSTLPLDGISWVISAIPDHAAGITHVDQSSMVVQTLRMAGYGGRIAIARRRNSDFPLESLPGVDLVLDPFRDAADRAVELMVADARRDIPAELAMDGQKALQC